MARITAGISQIGGKYRLLNTILEKIPYHEFYLEPFLGSGIVLLNKPRCRYECGNDLNGEIINYLLTIREYPEEFDQLKQGVFGLVSQEICNRIVRGELLPKNNVERAYFFYYLNKLTFGGAPYESKGFAGIIDQKRQNARIDKPGIEEAKASYSGMLNNFALGMLKEKEVEEAKENVNAQIKGINPKTTRPYTNNDCGLLSPLQPEAIKRLRYVNLTTYPFDKVYEMFYQAFHVRKGLGEECFLYVDPPYPGTEKYYKSGFGQEEHDILIKLLQESPFHWLLSIGGECEFYVEQLSDFVIEEIGVKYSTSANHQHECKEYLISNYAIEELPLMQFSSEQKGMDVWLNK